MNIKNLILAGTVLLALAFPQILLAANDTVAPKQENSGTLNFEVEGFRSAKFGMDPKEVLEAIYSDFKISKNNVNLEKNPIEKTSGLSIEVEKLIQEGGPARIIYIMGYKSGKLVQVNITWGTPINSRATANGLVDTANLLRNHLAGKGFKKDNLVMNARLEDGSILVFRGVDSKGKMVLLLLNIPQEDPKAKKGKTLDMTLRLNYIQNPNNPDIFQLETDDF